MRSLTDYRRMLEEIRGGTIPADLGLEIIATAEAAIESAQGELTIAQAMERSGRSRSYFERRVQHWAAQGRARRLGRVWLVSATVVPGREFDGSDPSASPEDIVAELDRLDRLAS